MDLGILAIGEVKYVVDTKRPMYFSSLLEIAFNPWLKDFLREKILGLDSLDARDPKSWQNLGTTFCQDRAKTFLQLIAKRPRDSRRMPTRSRGS
jgi:hypothetical protein